MRDPISIYGDGVKPIEFTLRGCTVRAKKGCGDKPVLTACNFRRVTIEETKFEGFASPHLVLRSEGEVRVSGGTGLRREFRPDPNDKTLTFTEALAEVAELPQDDVAWRTWCRSVPTPDESRWNEEKGLYVSAADPMSVDVWSSALAVLRGNTPHADRIAKSLCTGYQYYVGWGRTGAVKPDARASSELSPLPAGAFGYAMARFDPLFARTFFTDFLRRKDHPPAAVAGVRAALERLQNLHLKH